MRPWPSTLLHLSHAARWPGVSSLLRRGFFCILAMSLIRSQAQSSGERDLSVPANLFLSVEELMGQGNAEAALKLIAENPVDAENPAYGSYLLQWGWVELTRGQPALATQKLRQARAAGSDSPWLGIYLLQGCLQLNESACIDVEFRDLPDWVLREQQSLGRLAVREAVDGRRFAAAWHRLDRLEGAAPESDVYRLERYSMWLEFGLAHTWTEELVLDVQLRWRPRITQLVPHLASAAQKGWTKEVLQVLEIAMHISELSHRDRAELESLRGTIYASLGLNHLAAASFGRAALVSPRWHHAAADQYQKTGNWPLALYHNGLVLDRARQLEQRAIFSVQRADYERLAALDGSLRQVGLLDRDDIRFAVAYAQFRSGRLQRAERLLSGITDTRLFEKAAALRLEMARQMKGGASARPAGLPQSEESGEREYDETRRIPAGGS
jgi:hypothetical protein